MRALGFAIRAKSRVLSNTTTENCGQAISALKAEAVDVIPIAPYSANPASRAEGCVPHKVLLNFLICPRHGEADTFWGGRAEMLVISSQKSYVRGWQVISSWRVISRNLDFPCVFTTQTGRPDHQRHFTSTETFSLSTTPWGGQ